jgi:hypothetical protein
MNSVFSELKKELKINEYSWNTTEDKKIINVQLFGLRKEAIKLNNNEVLIRVVEDSTGLLVHKEELISSNVTELMGALIPRSISSPELSHMGMLIYWEGFEIELAINYIKNFLETRGDEIDFIKEEFNILLNKEDLSREDLKKFQHFLQINNRRGLSLLK